MVFTMFLLFCFSLLQAEGKSKLYRFTGGSGEGPYTSGMDLELMFKDKNDRKMFAVRGSYQRVYALFTSDVTDFLTIGGSFAFFKNLPNFGPYIVFRLYCLSITYWRGWSTGEIGNPRFVLNGFFESVDFTIKTGGLRLSYVSSTFNGKEFSIPGVSFEIPVNEKFRFFVDASYELIEERPLYLMGIRYYPHGK